LLTAQMAHQIASCAVTAAKTSAAFMMLLSFLHIWTPCTLGIDYLHKGME
jgi:hypothetical protein